MGLWMVSGHHKELARGPFCEHICSEIFQDSTMLFTSQGNCGFQVIKLAGDNGTTQCMAEVQVAFGPRFA